MNFTKRELEALPPAPAGKRTKHYDAKTPGLMLRVTDRGAKTFYLYRKINGKPELIQIGKFPAFTIENARKRAAEILGDLARGKAPSEIKGSGKTFGTLFSHFLNDYAKTHKRTWEKDEAYYNAHLKGWARRDPATISRDDVRALHQRITRNNGPYKANRVLSLVSAVFNYGIREYGLKAENPAKGVSRNPEHQRERRLTSEEIKAFLDAVLAEPSEDARDYLLLDLLTGARRGNLCSMEFEEVDWHNSRWEIPGIKFKNKSPQVVPLVPWAVNILQERRRRFKGGFVFPSHGRTGHLVETKSIVRRVLQRAGITDFRGHDIRRTLGSWMADTGASLPVIGKSLGQKSQAATAIYARLQTDPVRQAMETATNAMLVKAGLIKPAELIKMKRGGNRKRRA